MDNKFFGAKTILMILPGLTAFALGLSGCSTKVLHRDEAPAASAITPVAPVAPAPSPLEVIAAIHPMTPSPAHTNTLTGTSPEKALGWLKNGNRRFLKGSLRKDGQTSKDIHKLATGQSPHTIILSCSDSRVPPEVVFDQKLGEIFVIRVAGEALDTSAIGSIEYAVEHLGSRLLVVMGHSSCGAVKAALGTLDGSDAGSPALNALVHDIHPRIASFKRSIASKDVIDESWANTRGAAHDLLSRSKILQEKVASGKLVIKSAMYHLSDGNVDFDP